MEQGYIYLHRSLLNWEWYQDINTKAVFLHLLLTVNYQPKKWQGITIERGQRICTYEGLAEEIGLSVRNVRTAINHLKATSEVTWTNKQKYSLVQVVNYDKYQEVTSKATNCRQTADKLPTTTKEKKKKEINNNIPPYNPPLNSLESKKSLEKVQWAENVAMTNAQYEKLLCTYGEADTKRLIEILDNYKGAIGKKYEDDYRAILNWVVNRLKEEKSKNRITPKQQLLSSSCYNDYDSVLNR